MSTTQTVTAYLGDIAFDLTGTFYKGAPEQGPTYDCGGQPAEDPSFDVDDVKINGEDASEVWDFLTPYARDRLIEKAIEKLEEDQN